MRGMFARELTAWLGLALASSASTALASPMFELAGSSFGSGGFNGRATGRSAAATYFNPALLPQSKPGLELGWLVLSDSIQVTLDGRSHAQDVPDSEPFFLSPGRDVPSLPTSWLEKGCTPQTGSCVSEYPATPRQRQGSSGNVHAYQALGLVTHVWPRYLSLGLYGLVPMSSFTHAHSFFVDEREQYFSNSLHPELYGDRLEPVSLAFGAGSQVLDQLSIGLSFTLSLANRADARVYSGNSADLENTLQLSTKVDVKTSVSPHFGVLYQPLETLDLTFTVHTVQKMEIDTGFGILLPNGDDQYAKRPATHAYLPLILGAGASYDVLEDEQRTVSVVLSSTFERWSRYINRQTERPLKDYEWSNILTGTVGARYQEVDALGLYLDTTFHPTPVPDQTGRTNYVDNHRVGFLGGLTYDLPVEPWNVAFRFGAQGQFHFLPRRYQKKLDPTSAELRGASYSQLVIDEWPDDTGPPGDPVPYPEAKGLQTNNPGWPGFASQGFLAGGALSISLLY